RSTLFPYTTLFRSKNSSAVVRAKAISTIRCLCQHGKTRAERFPNLFFDFVDIAGAIDQDDAFWLMCSELAVSFAHALIKFGWLLFHSISFACCMLHSPLSSRSIDIEHESNIRDTIADGEGI